ncbi:uncharacterized protein CDAR_300761 [Caerostris darwini]|uniref:Major facilitator superfamily (MFS) profile domain-containing protein n=1 Tax=Caerostris darwini TaxID=1538125 RepID=A0AAV4U8L5_9ARAC|nr:uncharacterized protein CDAR_300761 [Caerostris darwini]
MAPDFLYFTILRFFVGITSSAVVSSPIALAQELVGPEYRNKVSVFSQSARSLGFMILSIMAFLVRDWSHIALQLVRVFPESPDWLKEKGRYEEVGRIFEVIAQANGRELTPEYIINMKRRFRIEKSMLEERKRNGTQTHYSVWNLFSGSNTSKKTTAIIFICHHFLPYPPLFKTPGKKTSLRTAGPPEDDDTRLECGPNPWNFAAQIAWEGDDDGYPM